MPIKAIIRKIFGKEDIVLSCQYCKKTGSKSIWRAFYGYECMIKREKRQNKRCRRCYFGHCR